VENYLELSCGFHQLNITFIRAAHDWEVDVFTLFFNLLYSLRLRQEGR
jgi:hypothetical protein